MSERISSYPAGFSEVAVNANTATTVAAVAATANKVAKIYRIVLVAAGATTVTFEDGVTALTGAITLTTGVPLILEYDGAPWFTTSVNSAFNIVNSAAIQISGRIYYTLAPASKE